jgi:SMC interacting uncharacterized protein involved in chromosome segregation
MNNQKSKEFFTPFKTAIYIDNLQKQYLKLAKDYDEMDKEFDELVDRFNKLKDMFNELANYFNDPKAIAEHLAKKYDFDYLTK